MKKLIIVGLAVSLSISTAGCKSILNNKVLANNADKKIEKQVEINHDELNQEAVTKLVEDFGSRLKNVSLLADINIVEESMMENYSEFVSKDLIEKWLDDLGNAPGRLVSSPWPDHIEIEKVDKLSDTIYTVEGEIIEKTNTEDGTSTQSIILHVEKIEDNWIIKDLSLGEYK